MGHSEPVTYPAYPRARARPALSVRPARALGLLAHYAGLLAMTVVMLGPFLYVVSASFRESITMLTYPPHLLPDHPTLANYDYVFTQLPILRWALNSVIMSVGITAGEVFLCAMAAYPFAKREFPLKNFLFGLAMATLMIPGGLTILPAFLVARGLGITDSFAGLILPGCPSVIGVFLLRQFMQSIPNELDDAARIDGCSDFGVFWRIILPVSAPGLAVLAILAFNWSWNLLLWPLVIIRSKDLVPLTVGLANIRTEFVVDYGMLSAGVFISVVPLMVMFLLLQRYFMAGIITGAVKQ